jgi:Ecdysteroid kinase-like family
LDARLIDFATARVASPSSDLALFIYISVDPKVLEADGLTNLLKTYYSALTDALSTMGKVKDPWSGDFHALEKDFARFVYSFALILVFNNNFHHRSAPFAYSICAFFLPLMMAPSGDFQMEDMMDMSPEEQQKQNMTLGGPEATQRLVDMLIDFQKRAFHKIW